MSLYSTAVATALIDPSFTSSRRCEFRIPFKNQAYLPNLRLGGVGVSSTNVAPYALGVGVASIIRRIALLDGEEEIDSLREANSWLNFKSFFRPNAEAAYIKMPLEGGGGRGITSSTSLETTTPLPFLKYASTAAQAAKNAQIHSGTIDLRTVFPILNAITHLSTNTFQNLRIVIEYETQDSKILQQTGNDPVPLVPFLMCDEITDEALIATLDKQLMSQPVYWDVIEVDRIGLAAIQGTDTAADGLKTQNVSLQSNGFLGKYVKRLCIQKSTQVEALNVVGTDVQGFGSNGSLSMHNEHANLRVNGRSLIAGQGYTTPAQMAMALSDTWGEINCPPYGAIESVGLDAAQAGCVNAPSGVAATNPSILIAGNEATARHANTTGQQAYMGFRIDSRVDALQIEYQRSGRFQENATTSRGQGGTNVALDLTCFAEVSKSMTVMGGGQWRIQYE